MDKVILQCFKYQPTSCQIATQVSRSFSDKIGTYTGGKVSIQIDPKIIPKFCKPQPLLFAMKGKVEDELKKLQE